MRDQFIKSLALQAAQDESVTLVIGDLGFGVVEEFAESFPNQFFNAGIAEQAMVGLSAGLASEGRRVFVYSIANFPTFRCLEQIRNDVCYHNLDVTICSIGCGFGYGSLGYSHHGLEDIAIMRPLPGLKIFCPSDPQEVDLAVRYAVKNPGPKYLRLGKNGERALRQATDLEFAPFCVLREGVDVAILGTGSIVSEAVVAADRLANHGISAAVVSCLQVWPLVPDLLRELAVPLIVTIEEHRTTGGFGSAVLEFLSDAAYGGSTSLIGVPANVIYPSGSQEWMRKLSGLSSDRIVELVLTRLRA